MEGGGGGFSLFIYPARKPYFCPDDVGMITNKSEDEFKYLQMDDFIKSVDE